VSAAGPLVDRFGRKHTDLRVSVTDRCNIRCFYCMPPEGVPFRAHDEILRFEQIERFVRVAARLGISEVRLTGGEPTVRKDISRLVSMLAAIPGIDDLSMTTNGILLAPLAGRLKEAGLDRLNISLDTLDREKYRQITQHDELPRVLEGIDAAIRAGFRPLKLNALAIRRLTEDEVVPLAEFARNRDIELRFIEFMPLDGHGQWSRQRVLPGEEILRILRHGVGPLEPVIAAGSTAPAEQYRFLDGGGVVAVIGSVSKPFCDRCSRLRLTADGQVQNCLFSNRRWDARGLLQANEPDEELACLIRDAVAAKCETHGTDNGEFAKTEWSMHQIGG
jgi:cyclic pyranopterin phosphate synthase